MPRRPMMVVRDIARLRQAIRDAGYDTVSLAAQIGRSKSLTGYLWSGTRTSTSEDTAHAIESALGVPHGTLFGAHMSAPSDDMEELLKHEDAAVRMGGSEKHVRRLMADGELEVSDIARSGSRRSKTRVKASSLNAYMHRQTQPVPARTT